VCFLLGLWRSMDSVVAS